MIFRIIPNLFTVGNLSLGIIAVLLAFEVKTEYAAIMIIISMLLDGFDGRIARFLNTQSDFGKELDSLSDVISFGVAPAIIMYVTILNEYGAIGWIITILFPVAGAIRLARFNVNPGMPGYFTGLPITIAGGVLATMALYNEIFHSALLMSLMVLLSYLMVSKIKYPNIKKITFSKKIIWMIPIIIIVIFVFAIIYPKELNRIIFVPLALYALYGISKGYKKKKNK